MNTAAKSTQLPLLMLKIPDHSALNVQLREILIGMSQSTPDKVTNQANQLSYFDNKWLSQSELHHSKEACFREIVSFAEDSANRKIPRANPASVLSVFSMWSIISKVGLEGVRHNHSGQVSGSYYVDAGSSGPEDGGLIQFYLDAGSAQPTHSIKPEAGTLLLFPSKLAHSVSRYSGTAQRIVIALNLR